MQAPPPVNVNGFTPQAANGDPQEGPSQEDVHAQIASLSLEEKGNTANSTSRRLAQTAGTLNGHTFKTTVGNTHTSATRYILPPDVAEEDFMAFIEAAKKVIGDANITINISAEHQAEADYERQPKFYVSAIISAFKCITRSVLQILMINQIIRQDFFAIQPKEENMSSAVLQPKTADEVSSIVKLANKYKMPVSPVSIGRNLGYGGTAPRLRGTATIDMKRMDQIIEANEESAYCLVEPGVSYFNMYEHLRKIGSNLWIDTREWLAARRE